MSRRNSLTEERGHKSCAAKDAVNPSQAQVLHSVPRKETHHTGNHKMNDGRAAKRHEKNIFAHVVNFLRLQS